MLQDRDMLRTGLARAAAVVLLANAIFLALVLLALPAPSLIDARIRAAFQAGDLDSVDYARATIRRGWHQYNDCKMLQMLSNPGQSRAERGLAPILYYSQPGEPEQCPTLRSLVVDGADRGTLLSFRYARFWHGDSVVAALALRFVELRTLRLLLLLAVAAAIATLGLVALRAGGHTRRAGVTIALAAGLLWAAPYFAPSLSHGPGDAFLVFALVGLVARPKTATTFRDLLPYAAGFGATVVFLEEMTGQFATAGVWLAALTLAMRRDDVESSGIAPVIAMVAAVAAFAVGGIATTLIKQILAALVSPDAVAVFLAKLAMYMGQPAPSGVVPPLLQPVVGLIRTADLLAYWNRRAGDFLAVAMALTWLAAVIRGWRYRSTSAGRDMLCLTAMALTPFVWGILLPTMTLTHLAIFVRLLVIPISLGPMALLWPAPTAR